MKFSINPNKNKFFQTFSCFICIRRDGRTSGRAGGRTSYLNRQSALMRTHVEQQQDWHTVMLCYATIPELLITLCWDNHRGFHNLIIIRPLFMELCSSSKSQYFAWLLETYFTFFVKNKFNKLSPPYSNLLIYCKVFIIWHCAKARWDILTLRRLMSYIYGAHIIDVSRSHTTTQHSR